MLKAPLASPLLLLAMVGPLSVLLAILAIAAAISRDSTALVLLALGVPLGLLAIAAFFWPVALAMRAARGRWPGQRGLVADPGPLWVTLAMLAAALAVLSALMWRLGGDVCPYLVDGIL